MRMTVLFDHRREWTAMAVSLLLHLTAVSILVLTFPIFSGIAKPSLTFLGSLLDHEDVAHKPFPLRPAAAKTSSPAAPFAFQSSVFNPERSVMGKPSYARALQGDARIILKSPPQADAPDVFDKNKIAAELGIDITMPNYEPLRLHVFHP